MDLYQNSLELFDYARFLLVQSLVFNLDLRSGKYRFLPSDNLDNKAN